MNTQVKQDMNESKFQKILVRNLDLSLRLSLSASFSRSLSLRLSVSFSLSVSLSLDLTLSLSPGPLSFSLGFSLSLSLSLSFSLGCTASRFLEGAMFAYGSIRIASAVPICFGCTPARDMRKGRAIENNLKP